MCIAGIGVQFALLPSVETNLPALPVWFGIDELSAAAVIWLFTQVRSAIASVRPSNRFISALSAVIATVTFGNFADTALDAAFVAKV